MSHGLTFPVLEVVRVVDGDTVDCRLDLGFHLNLVERFRLLGVDTPERGQVGWADATVFTADWLWTRRTEQDLDLRVESHKADSFGRWLGRFYVPGEPTDLGQDLIGAGLATEWTGRRA